jgi:hypothetical protein
MEDINRVELEMETQRAVLGGMITMLLLTIEQMAPIQVIAARMTDLRRGMDNLRRMKVTIVKGVRTSLYNNMPAFILKVDNTLAMGSAQIQTILMNKVRCTYCAGINVDKRDICPSRLIGMPFQAFERIRKPMNNVARNPDGTWGTKWLSVPIDGKHAISGGIHHGSMYNEELVNLLSSKQISLVLASGEGKFAFSRRNLDSRWSSHYSQHRTELKDLHIIMNANIQPDPASV